jgi:hypothetical protein
MASATRRRRSARQTGTLTLDEALIALFIGAMNANDHVAPDEAARAHHLIWSTRRFRRKSGDAVGKMIQDMRDVVEKTSSGAVIDRATKAIPARLRPSAFAVVADLLLADGRLEGPERRFLNRLATEMKLETDTARGIVALVAVKNQL